VKDGMSLQHRQTLGFFALLKCAEASNFTISNQIFWDAKHNDVILEALRMFNGRFYGLRSTLPMGPFSGG